MALKIIKNYLTKNRCYQQNTKRTPIGIQIHTIGTGQGTAQSVADYWNQAGVSACVTYCVDCDTEGKVLQLLPESTRTWADAGFGNNSLITIEICESDYIKYTSGASYTVLNDAKFKVDILRGYNTAVLLCADICKRYGWDPMKKLSNGLYLISSHDEGRRAGVSSGHVDPTHVWPKINKTMDKFRADVKAQLTGKKEPEKPDEKPSSETSTIEAKYKTLPVGNSTVYDVAKVVYGEAGILKSRNAYLAVAQCIHDMLDNGGYGNTVTDIMKKNFSAYGNAYTTNEICEAVYDVFYNGVKRFSNATLLQFRSFTKYSDGNGNMDKTKCASLLSKYEYLGKDALNNKWGHLYFGHKKDSSDDPVTTTHLYRVRDSKNNPKSQLGAFENLDNAKKLADENAGYCVYDETYKVVYISNKKEAPTPDTPSKFVPYSVKVESQYLRIRKEAGTDKEFIGKYTGKGIFTIVEEAVASDGSKWGLLKSYAEKRNGWIALDFTEKI